MHVALRPSGKPTKTINYNVLPEDTTVTFSTNLFQLMRASNKSQHGLLLGDGDGTGSNATEDDSLVGCGGLQGLRGSKRERCVAVGALSTVCRR